MAFTFVGDLSTDLDQVRMLIGDVVENIGPMPDGSNVPDALITALITLEGTAGRAAARVCEMLAMAWTPLTNSSVGGRSDGAGDRAEQWRQNAQTLRAEYGGGQTLTAGVIGLDFKEKDGSE